MNSKKSGTVKIIGVILLCIAVVLVGIFIFNKREKPSENAEKKNDPKNISYTIDGIPVELKDGVAETEATPGSASKVITKYFGNEVNKDLNGDGVDDMAFLITQESGGSGTFFYVVAAVNTGNGFVGSSAFLLGDRIAPQTTESGPDNSIIVNYQVRAPGEPMTAQPSIGKSVTLTLDANSMQLKEITEDSEEENQSEATLGMKTWRWTHTQYNDGKVVTPKKDVFTLTFNDDKTFSATTDCNSIGGTYSTDTSMISFGDMTSTLMYCEGSEEGLFQTILKDTVEYIFTPKGELVLNLKNDGGSVYFK